MLDGSDEELCEHWGEDIAIAMLEPVDEDGTDHSVRKSWKLYKKNLLNSFILKGAVHNF